MTDPAEIAKGLTEAQRELVVDMSGAWKFCTIDEVRDLNKAGVTIGRFMSFGDYAARLSPLGEAVRAVLQEKG